MNDFVYDICVIGAGSAGLSVAAGASQMGANVVLIEKGEMGGDCLNSGCVPSKALLAAGNAAQQGRVAKKFGIFFPEPDIDFAAVHAHDVIAQIAPHDSPERFEGLGVTVIREAAHFVDGRTVVAGDQTVKAKRFVIATGSSASVPPILGVEDVSYLTNESIFSLTERPEHLIVIGGGPIGCEMAQAHRRLGCKVTVLELFTIMPKDDPELVDVVRQQLIKDGIEIREDAGIERFERGDNGAIVVHVDGEALNCSHLLVATGRRPGVNGLGLDEAGVKFSPKGIEVDRRLRTSNKRIFAIGDVTGGYQFTHQAGYHAGIAIQNILFRLPARTDDSTLPWVTYTDPELAHVGLNAAELREADPKGTVITVPYKGNDRARAVRETDGIVKVMVDRKGRIRGASIVGSHAGELIQSWVLAMSQGLKIRAMTGFRAPYPTLGELNKAAGGEYFRPRLFSDFTRGVVRLLLRLP
ncbi:MAG: FAD-dependent oxidoreductase [Proteobacteria bacterium]|nr:FAD-dependent oxidoreductase [Pseudomonadota bacterium]